MAGSDGADGSPPAVSIGQNGELTSLVIAAHGTLSIGGGTQVSGAVAAFDITAGNNVTLTFQSGLPASTITTAGRQAVTSYSLPPASPIVGPVPGSTVLSFAVGLPLRSFSALQAVADAASDPTNAAYRQFLGPTDFMNNYAPSLNDYMNLTSWAQSNGFTVGSYPTNVLIDVTATAAQIEQALLVNLNYGSRPDGSTFYGPDRVPTLGLTLQILGVSGIDDYVPLVPLGGPPQPCAAGTLQPSDIRNNFFTAYGPFNCSALEGSNQSIGIFAPCGFNVSDITGYESDTGLAGVPSIEIQASNDPNGLSAGCPRCTGTLAPPRPVHTDTECPVDIEMALAVAPKAQIIAFEGSNQDSIFANMAANPSVKQFSSSFLTGTSALTQPLLTVLAAQGQSFFMGSGDAGAYQPASAMCVSTPATRSEEPPPPDVRSLQYVTVVGGVAMTSSGVISGTAFSGGGVLPSVTIPSYQVGVNNNILNADPSVSSTNRNLPDVAMVAQNMCEIVTNCGVKPPKGQPCPAANLVSGQAIANPGTSLAGPMWAGVIALANENTRLAGPVGFANPALYQARNETLNSIPAFNDVNDGTPNTNSCGFGYQTTPGYDLVTGLGTPTCALVQQLGGQPAITLGVSGTAGGPLICISGKDFSVNGSVTVQFTGVPGSNQGGGNPGCPVTTTLFRTITAASDGTIQLTDNEISDVANAVNRGIACCTASEIANGTVSVNVVDNATGLSATATMPASFWCSTGLTTQVLGAGCQPTPVTINYHQTGACNGDPSASVPYNAGPNQAYVVFHIESIDNSLGGSTNFFFDPSRLFVQQSTGEDFFNSSLGIYPDLFGPFAAVPATVSAGNVLAFSFGAFGATVVTTTNPDGAAEANQTSYLLGYNQSLTDPPVEFDKTNQSQTSFPDTEDCSTLSPLH